MTRMEQAREAAAKIANKRGLVDWGYAMLSGERDNDPEVQIALLASEMERDMIVAWLMEDAAKCRDDLSKLHERKVSTIALTTEWEMLIAWKVALADALARNKPHKETNDA